MFWSLCRGVACALALALVVSVPATAEQPAHISSPGPLTDIALGPTLDCQVTVQGHGMYWHPDEQLGECGTFLSIAGGALFGPVGPHRVVQPEPFERVSQSPVTGAGTKADPYLVTTTVRLGAGQFRAVELRENVRYITGEDFYFADVTVINRSSKRLSFTLYHAADCHLPDGGAFGVSYGYKVIPPYPIIGVGCSQHPNNSPSGQAQGLQPTTLGDHGYSYMQGFYEAVWQRVAHGTWLSDSVSENVQWDTAMAVAWLYDGLGAGVSANFNYAATFQIPTEPTVPPPIEPPTGPTPKQPEPGPQPPKPEDPASIVIRDPVFVPSSGGSADVIGRCSVRTGGRCFIEAASGLQRRAAVVQRGQLARLTFSLSPTQRRQLRNKCATELNVNVAVYEPAGHPARTTRRTIGVFCESLRGHCATVASSVFAPRPLTSPLAALARRERPPSARLAC